MAFDVIAATRKEQERALSPLRLTLTTGLVFGIVAVYFAVVGIVLSFHGRWIIYEVVTLGQALLIVVALGAGVQVARKSTARGGLALMAQGLGAGAVGGAVLSLLIVGMSLMNLRTMFIALSPQLFQMLAFGQDAPVAVLQLIALGALTAWIAVLLYVTPAALRRPLIWGLSAVAFVGLFQELLQLMLQYEGLVETIRATLFTWDGLKLDGALIVFVIFAGGMALWSLYRKRVHAYYDRLPSTAQRSVRMSFMGLGLVLLLLFPMAAGSFIGQVLLLVGLYVLMGLGLNLEVGLAGLLDLGFVAFFAVGAYTTALLTADSPYALASLSYWQALPIAVLMSLFVGILFGVPVLGIRGDYLAVATLGLGEIIRVVVVSDMAAPLLAGAQGVLNIPSPEIGALKLDNPVSLFYLTLVCAALAAYTAWRLENSRLGRAWAAVRDDEDVAQALGINLINVKLLAYGLGAAFAGVAGSIFAVMLTSIYPSSFQLLISINILALIIVGGMGSLPGVAVGALALIGLPELLREFGEYRFLFYGLVIIGMMRLKPEGLWPSAARRRELHLDEDEAIEVGYAAAASGVGSANPGGDGGR